MHERLLLKHLSRQEPFFLFGARGVGKTVLIRNFAGKFSNSVYIDLETMADRAIFNFDVSADETLKAICFLKDKELRGRGTLIILDEIGLCPAAVRWFVVMADRWLGGQADRRTGGQADIPLVVAVSSVLTQELKTLTKSESRTLQLFHLAPFSFEEFLMALDDRPSLDAFREVSVPYYSYEKLLNYFHVYSLIGGMPEIMSEYAEKRHLTTLKHNYERIESRFFQYLQYVTAGNRSREVAREVLQNSYPYAATRISYNHFGNLVKGSREISNAFRALEEAFLVKMILPVTMNVMPAAPDRSKFPRLQLLDTGLVNYFSGIQKPLFQSHDMNTIFEGQIARQVVGQEMLATADQGIHDGLQLNFWVRNKSQSTAEVDFVIPYSDNLIPVVVRSGEPGRLRSLHQFMDGAPHPYAVRLFAGKLAVQQTQTIRGKKFYLLNLPYFLAGKIKDHLKGFIRLAEGV